MTEILLDGEPVARFILAGEPESPAHLHLPADRAGERGALRGADSLDAGAARLSAAAERGGAGPPADISSALAARRDGGSARSEMRGSTTPSARK